MKKSQNSTVKLGEFVENPDNPSVASDDDIARLAGKLKRVPLGLTAMRIAYVTDAMEGKRMVISGNKRLRVLKQAYGENGEVPAEWFADVTAMSEAERHEFIVTANVSDGEWDVDRLLAQYDKSELGELMPSEDLEKLLDGIEEAEAEGETDADAVPEVPEEPKSKRGAVYQLGRHRVMCGDSTNAEDVARLMGGELADLLVTDPPYGISIVKPKQQKEVGGGGALHFKGKVGGGGIVDARDYANIIGDETTETARKSMDVAKSVSLNQIVFGGNYFTDFLPPKACWVVWDKQNTGNFADVELAWTSFDKGAKLYSYLWNGLARKGDRKTEGKTRVHPTQKPVGLIVSILQDFCKDESKILDLFGGSGSTLIACEKTGRNCYMSEMSSDYVDVIRRRWAEFVHGEGCDWEKLTPEVTND